MHFKTSFHVHFKDFHNHLCFGQIIELCLFFPTVWILYTFFYQYMAFKTSSILINRNCTCQQIDCSAITKMVIMKIIRNMKNVYHTLLRKYINYTVLKKYTHSDICWRWKVKVLVTQSCLSLCYPMDYSPSGSSVHGILQARILEWVAISFSRGSSQSRDWTQVSCIAGRFFTNWATRLEDHWRWYKKRKTVVLRCRKLC